MYGYIYKTTNLIDSKIYIGQHKANEFEPNKYIGSGNVLRKKFKEFGKNNFSCELLDIAESQKELDEKEIYWINQFDAINPNIGYNKAKGGQYPCFFTDQHHSEESKQKIAISRKNKICINNGVSNIYVEKNLLHEYLDLGYIKEPKKKRILTRIEKEQSYEKISKAKKGKFYFINDATKHCLMISKEEMPHFIALGYHYGNKKTKITDKIWMTDGKADYKISVTDVGKYLCYYGYRKGRITKGHTEQGKKEGAEKIRKKLLGKVFAPEVIAKRSAKLKGHVVTQETRNKISQKLKGKSYYTIESYTKALETKKKNNKPYPESAREKIRKHQLTNNSIHNATLKKVCVIKDGKRKCIGEKNLEKYLENGYRVYNKGDLKHE